MFSVDLEWALKKFWSPTFRLFPVFLSESKPFISAGKTGNSSSVIGFSNKYDKRFVFLASQTSKQPRIHYQEQYDMEEVKRATHGSKVL